MRKIFNKETLTKYIIYFTFASFAGYFYELVTIYLSSGTIVQNNNWGPYFQIYGFAIVIVSLIYDILKVNYNIKIIPFFITSIFLTMGIEFLGSWFIEATQGIRYWDYSHKIFNIAGRTTLLKGIEFSILVCISIYIIRPLLDKLLKYKIVVIIMIILFIIIMLDGITATFNILH